MNDLNDLSKSELINKLNKANDNINQLKKNVRDLQNKSFTEYIDSYIETWYENNKDDVDLGVVSCFGGLIKADLMPDELEKYMYKKIFKIAFSLLTDLKKPDICKKLKD